MKAQVDFDKKLQAWDGFGVNYVETSQTPDYKAKPQEYGGFSTLSEDKRREIIELVFGEQGLKPGIVKMFLDPFHQDEIKINKPGISEISADNYDHTTTTQWMRCFARQGLDKTRARGGELTFITTLYGPPGFMTKQKYVRGRDIDPEFKLECAKYMVSWAKYLRDDEGLPVKYISLHNEGEDLWRWPEDGSSANWEGGHDYNMHWPPELVVEFIKLVRQVLDAQGMSDVGVTPGETSNWFRFFEWGYAYAIADDAEALESLGLITSHSFGGHFQKAWFEEARSAGIDVLREKKPSLHSWITSMSMHNMDTWAFSTYRNMIYGAKLNGLIPWACIQLPKGWLKGDPNPGTAFRVDGNGGYEALPGYYHYKQLCRAGQPGMAVCRVISNDSGVNLLAFSSNGTANPDAFVIFNLYDEARDMEINISGSESTVFDGCRTSGNENYASLGSFELQNGILKYTAAPNSITTFFGCR